MKHSFKNSSSLPLSALYSVALLLIFSAPGYGAEEHMEEEGEAHEDGVVELTAAQIVENGIGLSEAGPGLLEQTLLLYGKTVPDPEQVSHVSARYAGLIRRIGPALGDRVEAGDSIATIEASNSLQSYEVQAPISGIVVEKHANPGEIAGENSLLTIANYSRMWVDLSVFPSDAPQIQPGQKVRISANGRTQQSTIRYLNPGQGGSPMVTARVPLPNSNLTWTPGLLVEGHVTVAETQVDLLVDGRALQSFENQQGVFVKDGDHYEFTPLVLGESDGRFTAVLDGLNPGDTYVVENSYLLKADLEKSAAGDEH